MVQFAAHRPEHHRDQPQQGGPSVVLGGGPAAPPGLDGVGGLLGLGPLLLGAVALGGLDDVGEQGGQPVGGAERGPVSSAPVSGVFSAATAGPGSRTGSPWRIARAAASSREPAGGEELADPVAFGALGRDAHRRVRE